MNDVVYLYGFVPADAPAPPPDLVGMAGAAVVLVDAGAVRAAVSHVPAAVFDPALIEGRLDDLAWVGTRGLEHEQVVAWFVDHADIVPARLFSLHSSVDALQTATAATADAIAARLRAFAGRREWNLKVACDAERLATHGAAVSPALRALDAEIEAAAPGRRYLLERKRAGVAQKEVRHAARRMADELLAALAVHAVDHRTLPLNEEPEAGNVVLAAALLVERERDALLQQDAHARIGALADIGVLVTFSGPWAPYRFLEADVDA